MCGIHGFITGDKAITTNSDDFIKDAFVANTLRGMDSSGIAIADVDGYYDYQKLPVSGQFFLGDKSAARLVAQSRTKSTMALCHVRAATQGSVSYNNAHPFVFEDADGRVLMGVHNGTLTNWKYKKGGNKHDVDSSWALNHIMDNGLDAFKDFTGAYCFVWWDSNTPDKMNVARNSERSLFVVYTPDNNMAFASEDGMLHWLMTRRSNKMVGNIKMIDKGIHYTFDLNNPTNVEKVELPSAPVVASTSYSRSHTSYETVIDKVAKVFKEAETVGTAATTPTPESPPVAESSMVSRAEKDAAADYKMDGKYGVFTAWGYDERTNVIHGTFTCTGYAGQIGAEMRNVTEDMDIATMDLAEVRVIGVLTDDSDFNVVVSHPIEAVVH